MADRYRILLSRRAAADLESIFHFIAQDSESNAAGMVGRVLDTIEGLAQFPHRNVIEGQVADLKYPVRSIPVKSWVIFFRVLEPQRVVRILRVRHGARRRLKRYD